MAAPPLFDISKIDLNQVRLTPDEVQQFNPQAGHMRHLDHVIWMNDEYSLALGVKQVRDDEFWVEGHIPGRPLLPGVIMIEAGAQLSSVLYRAKSKVDRFIGFARCDNAVFRGQVVPGDTLYLLAREESFRTRRFISDTQGIVDGQIVFEARITGMLL